MNQTQQKFVLETLGHPTDPPEDLRIDSSVLKKVTKVDGGWEILTEDSTGWILNKRDLPFGKYKWDGPKVGDRITLYCVQWSIVIGVAINDEILYLRSEREHEAQRILDIAKREREQHYDWLNQKDTLNAKVDALPEVFQWRIAKYRKNNPNFDKEYLGYELACCELAVLVADALREKADGDPYEIELTEINELMNWFVELPYEEQKALVPDGDWSNYSGNQVGFALRLAGCYLADYENSDIVSAHGAMAALVGSEAYGDIDPETGEPG